MTPDSFTVTFVLLLLVHVTESVLPVGVTIAERLLVSPLFILNSSAPEIVIPVAERTTFTVMVSLTFPTVAVIIAVPVFFASTTPDEVTVAIFVLLDDQLMESVLPVGDMVAVKFSVAFFSRVIELP